MMELDGNYFRNAGFSLVWMLIFVGGCLLVSGVVYVIARVKKSKEIWYEKIAKQALIAGF